ncbi:MAG TPA: hypothetical protein VHZ03_20485 [Trebonia sp.]|nr:hypothetical protein [Trebonia sp.]
MIGIRLYAAAAGYLTMLCAVVVGAFARTFISGGGWKVATQTAIAHTASAQSWMYLKELAPVAIVWALMLLLTPRGYRHAFHAAIIAAAVLGYLHFVPPALFTIRLPVGAARTVALVNADPYTPQLAAALSVPLGIVALLSGVAVFRHLEYLPVGTPRGPWRGSAVSYRVRRAGAGIVALGAFASLTWAAAALRLGSSASVAAWRSAGFQGGLLLGDYLPALAAFAALFAILIPESRAAGAALAAGAAIAAALGLAPQLAWYSLPSFGSGTLSRAGAALAGHDPWITLFAIVPASLLAIRAAASLIPQLEDKGFPLVALQLELLFGATREKEVAYL